jgi:Carboxypeptidase regulatory-like domain/Bacterial Ig domain
MHPTTSRSGRWHTAAPYLALGFVAFAFSGPAPQAQTTPPAQSRSGVVQLQRGRPFQGDLRQLPTSLPGQREHRPDRGEEREEPPLGATVGSEDRAVQTSAPAAPAPPPGSGNGAGSFAGLDFANFGDGWPPDTNGDVGPSYYIQTVNTSVGIFRKSDGVMVAGFSFDTLMSQGNFGNACDSQNFGDPTVVWDPGADRWIISDFAFTLNAGNPVAPYFQCFAVSRTGDPVTGGWNFYALETSDLFPDYPKVGVWPDALYLTANMFAGNTFKNVRVWALNKAQMYAGTGASAVTFNLPAKIQGVSVFTGIPSTYHTVTGTPPAGRPNFISVIWSSKLARIWKFHVDWNNTANSTLTGPSNVTLATWGVAGTSVPAKNGNALDTLRERLMVQSQYTNQGGTESVWLAHTVANPGNAALTSPRWYQINVTGGTVVTSGPLQQSTWAPDAAVARWMPSLAVDKDGNMAIGYSASSSTLFPAIRYAGRLVTDPANTLGQTEASLIEGTASQCCNFSDGSLNNRWGDYSAMTIDPDGCTFWYTTEYYQSPQPTTLAGDNWQTRIGSFKFPSCVPNSATLQGTVSSSATGNPISGATVSIGASSTTTDGSGQYTIGSLAPGTFNAAASAPGYTTATVSVTLSAGVTTTQNFALVASAGASTSLAVATASGTYGGTATLSATLTSSGTGVVGKSISFTLNGNPAGSASTNGSGIATLSNVSLSGIGAGTYPSGVGASFAGDGSYASSSGTNSLTVAKANQTITFGALAGKTYGDPSFTVSATASSGLVVSFGASGNCTIATTTVTITGAGSCTITASQPGDSNYNAAPNVPQTFTIAKASQTITFGPLADKTNSDPPFTVSATASSGLPVSFSANGSCTVSGNTVTITTTGTCTITASQAGNGNFNPAPDVPRTFNVTSGGGSGGPSAVFVGVDTTTQGSWRGVYGADGYNVINDTVSYPAYATVTPSGQAAWTWATSTTDVRALQKAAGTDRIAATWYGGTFSIDVNMGGSPHRLALYAVDWDGGGRTETVEIRDGATNGVLDSRTLSGFGSGRYLIWNVSGHVVVRVTNVAGVNAVLSGLFFDTGSSNPPPGVALTAPLEGASYTAPATIGLAANATDSDGINRVEFYQALGQGQPTLIGQPVTTSPYQLTWTNVAAGSYTLTAKAYDTLGASTVSAPVHVTVSTPGGGTTAAFVGTDTTTQGNWRGVYGADGYNVVNDTVSYPAYATVTPTGQAAWTWAASTSDVRALQKAAGTDRIAATWYGSLFSLDVNIVDGAQHDLALYVLDWDNAGRIETIEVRDAVSGSLLDSRTAASFTGGQYYRWRITGHVIVSVRLVNGVNAVLSGVFFK